MMYVEIEGVKSEGRGRATGNGWQDTADVAEAVRRELLRFEKTWDSLGHGAAVTYVITVAPESSPRRTTNPDPERAGRPLPVRR